MLCTPLMKNINIQGPTSLTKFFHIWINRVQTSRNKLFFTNLLVDPDDCENTRETDLWPSSAEWGSLLLPSGVSALSIWASPRMAIELCSLRSSSTKKKKVEIGKYDKAKYYFFFSLETDFKKNKCFKNIRKPMPHSHLFTSPNSVSKVLISFPATVKKTHHQQQQKSNIKKQPLRTRDCNRDIPLLWVSHADKERIKG